MSDEGVFDGVPWYGRLVAFVIIGAAWLAFVALLGLACRLMWGAFVTGWRLLP